MDIYVLNSDLKREYLIDSYESFIWTERWNEIGDFELNVVTTQWHKDILTEGVMLSIRDSNRLMMLETIEDTVDPEGRRMMKITGRSLEFILDNRVAKQNHTGLASEPTWDFNAVPNVIVNTIFQYICVDGGFSDRDILPNCTVDDFVLDDINFPSIAILRKQEPDTLYNIFNDICRTYNLGYRITIGDVNIGGSLMFACYSGNDYTTSGDNPNPVIFSVSLDNLQNTRQLKSIANYKNSAYGFGQQSFQSVYPSYYNEDATKYPTGWDRRVLLVTVDDDSSLTLADANAQLIQKSLEGLGNNPLAYSFDGELSPHSQYQYGYHYNLGDRVELRDPDGASNNMRVSEQIFSSDAEGDKSYPTLSLDMVVTPDTWDGTDSDKVWADGGTTEYWSNS